MEPSTLITALEAINYLEIFGLLLKWGIPFILLLLTKDILTSLANYIIVRADKKMAEGKWITINRFTGKIEKISPFSVSIKAENGTLYKVPITDFKHVRYHPVEKCPTEK